MGSLGQISAAFADGGIWMLAITAVQIVTIAIIAERIFALYVLRAPNQSKEAGQFEGEIKKGNISKALMRAKALNGSVPIAPVAEAGIQAAIDLGGREEIQAKMDEILAIENEKLEQRIGFLSMFANVATLLGLLGTIVGLIEAFAAVASLNPAEKAEKLTNGVALAMHATAYGLIVAIPTLVMYAILQNRAQRLSSDLNQGATKIFNWVSFGYDTVSRKSSSREKV